MNVFAVLALIGSVLCLSFGTAGLFGWFFRRRELRSLSKIRARQMVAQAQAEFPPHSRVRHACMQAIAKVQQ